MFLPFYILRYENSLPADKDKAAVDSLLNEYREIMKKLDLSDDSEMASRLIILTRRILNYVSRDRKRLKKGLGEIMGGKALTFKIDKMLAEAKASAEYICFKNCMDRGYDFDSAKALSGASDKAALGYLEKWKNEAVK